MKRRTTLGAIASALTVTTGVGATSGTVAAASATETDREIPRPVSLSNEAVQRAQMHARTQPAANVNYDELTNRYATTEANRQRALLEKSEATSDNWDALVAARQSAVSGYTVEGYQKAASETISETSIEKKAASVRTDIERAKQALNRQPTSDLALVVLGEVQHSLNAGADHLDQIPSLFESGRRSNEIRLAQAYSAIKAASMSVTDAKLINTSNSKVFGAAGNSGPSVAYDSVIPTESGDVAASYDADTYGAVAAESADGYRKRATTLAERGFDEAAVISSLKADAMIGAADALTAVPNPWTTDERVSLSATNERAERARASVEKANAERADDPLSLVLLNTAYDQQLYATSMLQRAESQQNPEETESLVISLASYRTAETIASSLGTLLG